MILIQCREKEGRASKVISSEFSDSSLQGHEAELKDKTWGCSKLYHHPLQTFCTARNL